MNRPISPNSKAALVGSVKTVPLFQLVPLRRKNKDGVSTSNPNGIHSRTCESDSEDTVQSLSPLKLLECRTSSCVTDRRPSDSSVKSIGSLGSKSRRKESTPKSRPRLSLQAALASENQSKLRSSSNHPTEGKSRISSSTELDRRLIVPSIEAGGVADKATPVSTSTARISDSHKDAKGKDKRKDREKQIMLGIEREMEKEKVRLRDLATKIDRLRESEKEIEREEIQDEERLKVTEIENKITEREQNEIEIEKDMDHEREEERVRKERDGIVVVEGVAEKVTDPISEPFIDTGGNSSCRIISKASTSSSVSTLATSSCSEKFVRDDKESRAT